MHVSAGASDPRGQRSVIVSERRYQRRKRESLCARGLGNFDFRSFLRNVFAS